MAEHRRQPLMPLAVALREMPDRQAPYAAMIDRMGYLVAPPSSWTQLIAEVSAFVDPLLAEGGHRLSAWNAETLSWT